MGFPFERDAKKYFVSERQKDGWVGEKWVGLRTVEVTVELMDVGERGGKRQTGHESDPGQNEFT